jgi:hypothetical protein
MSHHHKPTSGLVRVFVACSSEYNNRRALMQAFASIFLDTIEGQREYYYFECPAMAEILDDGFLNRAIFHQCVHGDAGDAAAIKALKFTHIVAGGDDAFIEGLVAEIASPDALLIRLL